MQCLTADSSLNSNSCAQEETGEYLDQAKLKELVGKYSEFIDFPIYLYASKEVDVEAPEEADEAEDTEAGDEPADDDISDETEGMSQPLGQCILQPSITVATTQLFQLK